MYKLAFVISLSVLLLVSSGCAKYWYQEGKSFNECKQARALCFEELKKRTDFAGVTSEYELKYMTECMQAQGYREVSAGELPMNAKREEPASTFHWRARGIAGTLAP